MKRRTAWLIILLLSLPMSMAWAQSSASDELPLALLLAGRYDELDARLTAKQLAYKRGQLEDEALLAAFRPFYDVSNPEYLARLQAWVAAKPRSYVARLALGIHYKYVGIHARAAPAGAWNSNAVQREMAEGFERAGDVLKASLALDDKPLLSYQHLMDPYARLLLFRSNRDLLDEAIAIDPGNYIVRRKYLASMGGRENASLDQMREFVEECRGAGLSAERMAKLDVAIEVARADHAYAASNYRLAEEIYSKAVDANPEDLEVQVALLRTQVKLRECDSAIPLANRILQTDPKRSGAMVDRGYCHLRQQRFHEAIADYQAAAELGNVWALKELALMHWKGSFVPQDRFKTAVLLRRAAQAGDPEAQEDLEEITGERIVTKVGVREAIPVVTWVGMPLLILGFSVILARRRVRAEVEARRLRYPAGRYWALAVTATLATGVFYLASFEPHPQWQRWSGAAVGVLCALAFIRGALDFIFISHDLRDDGIRLTSWFGQHSFFNWARIDSVRFSALRHAFQLTGPGGDVVHVQDYLDHVQLFAQSVLERVPREVIEDSAHAWLSEIANPASDEDPAEDLV